VTSCCATIQQFNQERRTIMRFTKLMTVLFGAMLFIALGVTTASAMDKCGAGKCGDAKPAEMKCGAGKCGGEKKSEAMKCGGEKKAKAMKCGAGKCGGEKPAKKAKPAMKCGAGKCG
jgi:uncharacterized low-complexity protein